MRRTITGFSNPTVKFLKSLRDKKHRGARASSWPRAAPADRRARDGRLPEMLMMAEGREGHPLLLRWKMMCWPGGDVVETSEDILAKITGKDNPQAVCGVFAEFDTSLAGVDRHAAPIWLVAQAMRDPGNLGTMLRTGDAVGAGGLILLDDCVDPFSVEAVRASMGAIFTQRWCVRGGTSSCLGCAGARGNWWRHPCARRCPIAARPMRAVLRDGGQ
jgi:TrmH family RNA methyltransferase